MGIENKIFAYLNELITDESLFVVDIRVSGTTQKKVSIILDGDQGISVDTCGDISRKIGNLIEEDELIDTKYTLEVSSPGLEQPLKLKRQYIKNIGRDVKIWLSKGNIIKGKLLEVHEEHILLEEEITEKVGKKKKKTTNEKTISFDQIDKTNIQVSFK